MTIYSAQKSEIKTLLRAVLIALLLIVDALIGKLRTIPPVSLVYLFLILFILSGWWLWRTIHKRGIPRTPITIPIIFYLIVVIISTIYSVDQRRSLDGLIATCGVVLVFFVICDLLTSGWKVEILEIALLIFFTYLIIHGLWKIFDWYRFWYTIQVPDYPPYLIRYRLFGISAWPSKLVMLINAGIPFAIFRLSNAKSFWKKILWGLWLFAALIIVLYSDTRGGFVALIFILAITLGWLIYIKGVPFRENPLFWLKKNSSILLMLFAYIGVFFLISYVNGLISPHSGYVRHGGGITAGRIDFWRVAIDIFQNYPFVGSGPMTYPRFYIQELPGGINGWISPHAHNIILNTAAQLGVLGLLALGSILISLVLVLLYSNKLRALVLFEPQKSHAHLLVGVIAALSGFFIQSLFDRLEEIPHTMLSILLILSIGLYILNQIKVQEKSYTYNTYIFILLLFLITGILVRQYSAHASQFKSLQSGYERNWKEAADFIESAVNYDPNLNFYYEQRGYALGALALSSDTTNNETALKEAIESFKFANESFTYWAPNHVNLAELLEHAGQPEEALATLESIPYEWFQVWPFPALFLADKYQSLGYSSKADELYKIALNRRIRLKEYAICKQSKTCQKIAIQIQIEENGEYTTHEKAISRINGGFPDQAIALLQKISPGESSPLIWVDRAAAHLALNELPQSEYALAIAEKLNVLNQPISASMFALTKANLLLRKNRSDEAIEILESVVRPMIRLRNYEVLVYQRIGFPNPLIPSLAILEQNKYDLLIYSELANLYMQYGRQNDAEWARNQASILSDLLETE